MHSVEFAALLGVIIVQRLDRSDMIKRFDSYYPIQSNKK